MTIVQHYTKQGDHAADPISYFQNHNIQILKINKLFNTESIPQEQLNAPVTHTHTFSYGEFRIKPQSSAEK